jgi:class 3 adenylate cyclase
VDSGRLAAAIEDANVRWEIGIHRIMALLIVAAALMLVAIRPAIGGDLADPEIALCLIAILHFAASSALLRKMRGRWLQPMRWFSVTAEASFGTLAIVLCTWIKGAEWAATSPTVLIYALALVACSVRIQPRLTAYATAVAIVELVALYYFYIYPQLPEGSALTANPWATWERAFWLALIGGTATFATLQVRKISLASGYQAQRRAWVMQEFSKFVSADAAEIVLNGAAKRGTYARRNLTVLFCDLRDFTGMCERERPDDVVQLLNDFYARACEVVRDHGGQINKFLGDGLLALFDPTRMAGNDAEAAIRAALALCAEAEALRNRSGIWAQLHTGIGIDTGPVVIGTVGSDERLEFTAIGSTVNRAARLQAFAGSGATRIVVSDSTARAVDGACELAPLGSVEVKGFERPVEIYEPVAGGHRFAASAQ